MKRLGFYNKVLNCNNEDEVFNFLINHLKETIKSWDYFVNWDKVKSNVLNIEVGLNILNTLIGKENPKDVFINLIKEYPNVISCIPILLATRDTEMVVLNPNENNIFSYEKYSFKKLLKVSDEEAIKYANFLEKTGFFQLIKNKEIKNLVDYVYGVEVGLDSNGRKNRSGTSMEKLTELYVNRACNKLGFTYITQANSNEIKNKFNETIVVDKNERRFDFVVKTNSNLILIETNYYGGGGSKLKATAGEYKALYDFTKMKNTNADFIWITDGKGWLTSKNPLRETFDHTDYIFNLDMLQKGILEYIFSKFS
ncbi:Type II restriction endonuclease BstXII [Bacillus sp. X1(2014)]|nr:Type II restriction endonuclease BstXII [Bacillus sp. X1(2014)]